MTDEHLLRSILRAIEDTAAIVVHGEQRFFGDPLLQRAAKNIVAEIGEAASALSDESRALTPSVPWRLIIGMRHKVVHDYAEVDLHVLWNTLIRDVPLLEEALLDDE